jgi:hypothetical protein
VEKSAISRPNLREFLDVDLARVKLGQIDGVLGSLGAIRVICAPGSVAKVSSCSGGGPILFDGGRSAPRKEGQSMIVALFSVIWGGEIADNGATIIG